MNKENAEASGRATGQAHQRIQRGHGRSLSEEKYKDDGVDTARIYVRAPKTRELFIKGWNAAWEPVKPVEHNPNSRFCSCPECMKQESK